MKPGELQRYFIDNLEGYYNEREIRNMFFLLLEHYFQIDRIHFFTENDRDFSKTDLQKIRRTIKQLKTFKPIQYILGSAVFCGLTFKITPAVLIPRPETEELIDLILQRFSSAGKKPVQILDIGTGSGCLAVSLAALLKNSKVWACDIQHPAITIARKNADSNQVNIDFFNIDILLEDIPSKLPQFDLIVSNPPYIRNAEKNQMKPNVLLYEPPEALFVPDEDPLLFYRAIALKATKHLKPGGRLFFEINEDFGKELVDMLERLNYKEVTLWNDIHGKDRFIEATHKKNRQKTVNSSPNC